MSSALDIADHAVGAALFGASLIAWRRRPASRVGALFGLAGATWFAGSVFGSLLYLHRGPLVHLHLSYPTGRLHRWPTRAVVAIAYFTAAVPQLAGDDRVTLAVAGLVVVTAAAIFVPTLGPTRRALLPALGAAFAFAAVLALVAVRRIAGWAISEAVTWTYYAVIVAVTAVLLVDLLRGRWARAVVSSLVVDLGAQASTVGLRGALARALGDRSLVIGYWDHAARRYLDDKGSTVDIEGLQPGRVATTIADVDAPLAVLVHDDAVLDDPRHVEAVAAAARLAVSSARLRTESRQRIEQLAASRMRIVAAADAQRDRLERQLREGAQHQLELVSQHLATAAGLASGDTAIALAALDDELAEVRAELDELAHGIHPRALLEGGLAGALPKLVDRARVPVSLDVEVERLPKRLEAAVYFVCAEALTNAAKHAGAATVAVSVRRTGDDVYVEVTDNGAGGADIRGGSGLPGLADRVEALGGVLTVQSSLGTGTRLLATLPIRGATETSTRSTGLRTG